VLHLEPSRLASEPRSHQCQERRQVQQECPLEDQRHRRKQEERQRRRWVSRSRQIAARSAMSGYANP
jgi:hypothetical protein